jgi:tetratricopeptide (TPR) repeat protein
MRGCLVPIFCLFLVGSVEAAPKKTSTKSKKVEPEPTDAPGFYARGQSHYDRKRYSEALEDYKKAYELDPLPAFLYNIASCYERLEKAEQAKYFYEEFLITNPSAEHRADAERSIEYLESLLEKDRSKTPNRTELDIAASHYRKGEAAFIAKRYEEAAREFAAAYVIVPSNLGLYNIAQANQYAGKTSVAIDYYRRYISRTETSTDANEVAYRNNSLELLLQLGAQPLDIQYPALYLSPETVPSDTLRPPRHLGRKLAIGGVSVAVLAGGFFLGQFLLVNRLEGSSDNVIIP